MKNYNDNNVTYNEENRRKGMVHWKAHSTVLIIATIFNNYSTVYDKGLNE